MFTTSAAFGGGAMSVCGQIADRIYLDEQDYIIDTDFDSILAIAGEREDIGALFLSSTSTGARKCLWQCCTDPKMHFHEFHFSFTCNSQWSAKMEEKFSAQLSQQGYIHEVLSQFGTQETVVFDKEKLAANMKIERYAYAQLTYSQQYSVEQNKWNVEMLISNLSDLGVFKPNLFMTIGFDWDKYGI